ncbi:MAG: hypothetical protein CL455_05070 [Acidimicrobiaceae bacterium]|nr:hypothetical protein [Acidimicrobiaceae bacterium]MEC7843854.1 C45 family peptidase [Actinomycetota bacterium]|tara:strand:- start:286 stop:1380 length:1095 start_codon:yes stop_codon:yes gene_type:complete
MKRPAIRILDAKGSSEEIGQLHGTQYAEEIQKYAEDRIQLVAAGSWSGAPMTKTDIHDLAGSMIPAHREFNEELFAELTAIAHGAQISVEEAIIVGGFTDFVDAVRAETGGRIPSELQEDDCTAVLVPNNRAGGSGFLAQTWDMHDTATDHVVLLRLQPTNKPAAIIFSTTGCLGQIGMNEHGVAVGINNLTGDDGKRGVTWTSVVRGMLHEETADAALQVLLQADLAGAHNYLIMDKNGNGFNVEAMPSIRPIQELSDEPIVHTNHAVAPSAKAVQAARPEDLLMNSIRRLDRGIELLDKGDVDTQRLIELTQDQEAICRRPEQPHLIESSGAAIMRPATKEFWACWGQPSENDYKLIGWDND